MSIHAYILLVTRQGFDLSAAAVLHSWGCMRNCAQWLISLQAGTIHYGEEIGEHHQCWETR